MLDALSIALPLVIATVLIASAIGKLQTPVDLSEWRELGVPTALRREWLRRLHPLSELALGLAMALFGGWLGVFVSVVVLGLMLVYTVLVARVAAQSRDASCACFGTYQQVTRTTVLRNVWLSVVAVAATATIGATPPLGGALVAGLREPSLLVGLAVVAVTTALILWPDAARGNTEDPAPAADRVGPGLGADLDYVRSRTPAVPVTLADGSSVTLRHLTTQRPALLLAVSSTCGWCQTVVERRVMYRHMLPEVDVRLLMSEPVDSAWAERDEPQSLHDEADYVQDSIGYTGTPSAVLLGVDGLLAGGPVTGHLVVDRFVDDIYESLHGERPTRDPVASN